MSKQSFANKLSMAETADKHKLYQLAVQDVETEIDFVDETYERLRGRKAVLLREDFCGTMNSACQWVRKRDGNRAVAVDLDASVLDWGCRHNISALPADMRNRVEYFNKNVIETKTPGIDITLAMNFSYFIFLTRKDMLEYFTAVRSNLATDGMFFLDIFGGYDAYRELKEARKLDGFTYIWEQARFDPITHETLCHIHFKFPDKSVMDKAFSYYWRMWSIPEIKELLAEAGFRRVDVYWEGTDEETEEGDGIYQLVEHGDADAGWISYIVAQR